MTNSPPKSLRDVIGQILSATTAAEIEAARSAQRNWAKAHPEDRLAVLRAGEQLTLLERSRGA